MSKRSEYQNAVERLHDMLVQRSRGGGGDEGEYRRLREYVLESEDLAEHAPEWLRRMRSQDIWWANIQPLYGTYAERQRYVSDEFEPLFAYIESLPREGEVTLPQPTPKPVTRRASPEEVQHANDDMMTFLDRLTAPAQREQRARSGLNSIAAGHGQPQSYAPTSAGPTTTGRTAKETRVFIVHGHDTNRREAVARFVERLDFEAVILADQPDQGRTIIEKFEAHTDVEYAIVVMTPDDSGAAKGGRVQSRARQNVVLEHGFFIGLLGRKHVAALVVGDIEKPSDLSGVLYIAWDEGGAWKTRLAREMRAAGLPVDMNRV